MEPLAFFLSTFTALVDRIINLEKRKLQNDRDLFNEIVEPLFEELQPVALKYMEIFRKAAFALEKDKKVDFRKIAWEIKDQRDAIVMARIKVSEMASQIRHHINNIEIQNFSDDVDKFFYGTEKKETTTASRLIIMFFNLGLDQFITKNEVVLYMTENLKFMEKQWASIVKRYQAIKIYSLSSTKTVRSNKL